MRIDLFLDTSTDNVITTARTLRALADALTEMPAPIPIVDALNPEHEPVKVLEIPPAAIERKPKNTKPKAEPVTPENPPAIKEEKKTDETTDKPIGIEQVRAVADPLIAGGKHKEVASTLALFGAKTVSGVPKDKYAEFVEQLKLIK